MTTISNALKFLKHHVSHSCHLRWQMLPPPRPLDGRAASKEEARTPGPDNLPGPRLRLRPPPGPGFPWDRGGGRPDPLLTGIPRSGPAHRQGL